MVEVKLFCAIADDTGSAFPVGIDASLSVGDLKEKIRRLNEKSITCDAKDLQLFLAKKAGGAWLKSKDLIRMRKGQSTNNETEGMYMVEELDDPTDQISQMFRQGQSSGSVSVGGGDAAVAGGSVSVSGGSSSGASSVSGGDVAVSGGAGAAVGNVTVSAGATDGLIHVLVKVPTDEKTSSPIEEAMTLLFRHTFLNISSTTPSRTQKLKKKLVWNYQCDGGTNQNGDPMLLCMVMNIALPSPLVIASHLFRRELDDIKECFVEIPDIDDVRNGLLLFKPIESAFDDLDLAFLVDEQDQFTLKIFNPDIETKLLVDSLTQHQWELLGGHRLPPDWRRSMRPLLAPNAPQFDILTTFGELDRKMLQFPSGSTLRPFRRCLYHQAVLARTKAIIERPTTETYSFEDFSSEGFTVGEKMKLFTSSLSTS